MSYATRPWEVDNYGAFSVTAWEEFGFIFCASATERMELGGLSLYGTMTGPGLRTKDQRATTRHHNGMLRAHMVLS